MRDKLGCILEYRTESSEQCRMVLEALCEGIVLANEVLMATSKNLPQRPAYHYEKPRMNDGARQKIALASEIGTRGRATCIEWACARAAADRLDGVPCDVRVIPFVDVNGDPVPFDFHAVIQRSDGSIHDVTPELQGYAPAVGGQWWKNAGHCCESCAHGHDCDGEEHCDTDAPREAVRGRYSPNPGAGKRSAPGGC